MIRSDPKFDPDYFQINLGPSNHVSSDLLISDRPNIQFGWTIRLVTTFVNNM